MAAVDASEYYGSGSWHQPNIDVIVCWYVEPFLIID